VPTRAIRAFYRFVSFPLCFFGGVWLAHHLMARGFDPGLVVMGAAVLTAGVVIAGEQVLPYAASWNRSHRDVLADLLHSVLSNGGVSAVVRPLILGAAVWLASMIDVPWSVWPTGWPWPLQLALALMAAEFAHYWVHRWMHTVPWMWRLHAIHHSAPRLYWLNAGRSHPLAVGVILLFDMPAMLLLGAPDEALAMYLVATAIHGLFQHANIDLRLGVLNHVFSMAELHRWHHARSGPGGLSNYGGNLIVWDAVFGTRYLPAEGIAEDGLGFQGDDAYPEGFLGQLAAPFRGDPHSFGQRRQAARPAADR